MCETATQLIAILQALLTPTIGIITAYIAYRQYRDGKVKLDLERYERRLVVYKAVRRFLSDIVQTAKVESEDIRRLRVDSKRTSSTALHPHSTRAISVHFGPPWTSPRLVDGCDLGIMVSRLR